MALGQARRPSGLSEKSGSNMILGAGAVFYDTDLSDIKNGMPAEDFLKIMDEWQADGKGFGATTGDPTITVGRGMTRIETNDLFADVKGMFDSRGEGGVSLSFTVQELANFETWRRILGTTFADPDDGSIRIGTVFLPEHYKTISYVNMANNGDLLLFALINAVPTEDTVATFSNTTGTPSNVPVSFTATLASLEEMQSGALPLKQYLFPFSSAGGLSAGIGGLSADVGGKKKSTEKGFDAE